MRTTKTQEPVLRLQPTVCHCCRYEGFDENHKGLGWDIYRVEDDRLDCRRVCFWCGHADDDGEPQF
jgi:hypothetical protein